MIFRRRKNGSQRESAPVRVTFFPNTAGQGGNSDLTFRDSEGNWYWLQVETDEEARELMSQSQIIFRHVK